jgi:hypothetical protein
LFFVLCSLFFVLCSLFFVLCSLFFVLCSCSLFFVLCSCVLICEGQVVSMRVLLHKGSASSPHDAQPVTPADVDPLEARLDEARKKKQRKEPEISSHRPLLAALAQADADQHGTRALQESRGEQERQEQGAVRANQLRAGGAQRSAARHQGEGDVCALVFLVCLFCLFVLVC